MTAAKLARTTSAGHPDPDPCAVRACADRRLPAELLGPAADAAIAENPANLPSPALMAAWNPGVRGLQPTPAGLALITGKLWALGRELRVRFVGGTPARRRAVMAAAEEWSKHCSIAFRQISRGTAEIRAGFDFRLGSWSYLGTDSLVLPQDQITLNIGWEPDPATCLHELGHALGCVHEHQHPDGGIPWDVPKVLAYYRRTLGWTAKMVRDNVLSVYDRATLTNGRFDKHSVMLYPIAPELLTDPRRATGWNTALSAGDRAYIGHVYPKGLRAAGAMAC